MDEGRRTVSMMSMEEAYQLVYDSKPRLRFCELFNDDSSLWNYETHSHPYIELIYYLDGKGNVEISGENVTFSLYDTIVYPAHQKHLDEEVSEKQREIICLWIDIPELIFEEPVRLHERDSVLKHAFEQVYREAKREKSEKKVLEYAMKILMITILRMRAEASTGEQILDRTMEYLTNHYTEKITLEELAELEHISTSYLSRKFKQRTGVPVITYINRLRVEKARQLLMASLLDINEIAYQTGFDSPKYFHRVFKSVTGESPASFRRHYKRSS